MADVQKYFEEFHNNIKLGRFKEEAVLCEKRDAVINKLSAGLESLFDEKNEAVPVYSWFNQGSYEMGTGIKPTDEDYDIDVGVVFKISKDDYDSVVVKEWVYDALVGHTQDIQMRRPCVTVFYQNEGEPIYHVDLAIYSSSDNNSDECQYLAKGKLNSLEEFREWEKSDPEALCSLIGSRFAGDDAKQFRRIIRYLKRWKCYKFTSGGHGVPTGIALTIAAYKWFAPKATVDSFANRTRYNDLEALRGLVSTLLSSFALGYRDNEYVRRLQVKLPVEPYCDLFDRMTNRQMEVFQEKLQTLLSSLTSAASDADPAEACKSLHAQFGDDFPVPTKEDTAKRTVQGFTSSSKSASHPEI